MLKAKLTLRSCIKSKTAVIKVKVFSLQAIRQVGEWKYVQSCVTLMLDGIQWSTLRPSPFSPGKEHSQLFNKILSSPQNQPCLSGEERISLRYRETNFSSSSS